MPETPHNIFFSKREELGYSVNEVETATKIYKKYIYALEKKNYAVLPSPVYAINFIKSYAAFLEIAESEEVADYLREYKNASSEEKQSEVLKKYVHTSSPRVFNIPKFLKVGTGIFIVSLSLLYLSLQIREIFQQPQLEIIEPLNNLITRESTILIKGKTDPAVEVFINESIVLGDEKGNFERTVDLQPGLNLITITATSKHKKQTNLVRQILFEPQKTL